VARDRTLCGHPLPSLGPNKPSPESGHGRRLRPPTRQSGIRSILALSAPLGAHVLGGRHPGALPNRLRAFSAVGAAILVGVCALVILARAGAIGWPAGATGLLALASRAIGVFLELNTLGNLASKSRLERTVFLA